MKESTMAKKEIIIPPDVLESREKWGYSEAIRAGDTIYLAGMVDRDEEGLVWHKGDFPAQAAQCYRNIKRTLAAANSRLEDIVWMTFLNKDVGYWPQQYPIWRAFYGTVGHRCHYPAGTCIQIANLWEPDILLEVQAIAYLGEKEVIIPPNVLKSREKWGYSQAIKAGETIYLAGMVAWDEDGNVVGKDFATQAAQCYENMKRTLAAAGAGMEDIVWMTFLNKDVRLFPQQFPAWKKYFGRHCPAMTCVEVPALYQPELLLEVQAIAYLGEKEVITPPDVLKSQEKFGYSQAIKAGDTIYLAGMVALDEEANIVGKGDFPAQAAQCYENAKRTLAAAGAGMEDIVWVTFLNKDVRLFPKQYSVWRKYFGPHCPAGTCVQVANLYEPELLMEFQAIAVVDG
jgi:enamine deaminase RidA (YjgF/YER057c/UK114 family)